MAENVVVTTLEIKGGDKVSTTMKDLKNEIAGYRDELVALGQVENKTAQQEERQEEVIKRLRSATKLLTEVTNAHKESVKKEDEQVDLMNDSYNALQARLTKLKKAYKDMVSTERDSPMGQETLQEISDLDLKLKELDAGMGVYNRNVGNYGQTFEESMNQARQSAGFMQQGIGTLQGALGLMGAENEGVTKTLAALGLAMQVLTNEGVTKAIVKIKDWIAAKVAARAAAKAEAAETKAHTAAMAADAVATNTATTATNLFKKALIATGIGAIVVAVGALITYWEEFSELIGLSTSEFEKNIELQKEKLEELHKEMERGVDIMKARGATDEQVFAKQIDNAIQLLAATKKINEAIIADESDDVFVNDDKIKEAEEAIKEAGEELNNILHDASVNLRSVITESSEAWDTRGMTEYELAVQNVNTRYEQMKALAQQIKEADKEGITEMSANLDSYLQELDEWKNQQLTMLTEAEEQKSNATKQGAEQTKEVLAETEEEIEAMLAEEQKALQEQAQVAIDYWVAEAERKKKAAEEEAQLRAERKKAEEEELMAVIEATAAKAAAEEEELQREKEIQAERQRLAEEEKTRNKERAASYIDATTAGLDAVSNILSVVSDSIEESGEEDKEAKKKAKNLKIATATIETISGAISAYMSAQSLPFPANVAVGAVQAAAVTAAGFSNIAKIKATPIDGGGGSSAPSTASASVSAPNIQTQLPQTRNLTSASEEEALNNATKSQKVYILQSDIEAASDLSKAQVSESSF